MVADIARTSARVVGVYHHGAQIGYARVLSDRHTTAYLADVYVLEEHRGRGLGRALVGAAVDGDPQLAPLRWMLHTRDMHRLYREFGFRSRTTGSSSACDRAGRPARAAARRRSSRGRGWWWPRRPSTGRATPPSTRTTTSAAG